MTAEYGPILISGVTGFIGSHVTKLLLEEGYKVRGTVRSLENEEKIAPLKNLVPDSKFPLELFEANLNSDDGWETALEGCRALIHVASPFPNVAETECSEEEIIETAKGGTLRILKAASTAKVEKVVLTSSIASIFADLNSEDKIYTEEDWADTESPNIDAYSKSKALAEKAAWDFVKELPEGNKFDLSVINPSFVLGPILLECQKSATSVSFLLNIINRTYPAVPKLGFNICDVRDVAQAHLKALLNPNAWGHRHIICTCNMWMKDVAAVLNKEFRSQGYNIPTGQLPYAVCWMAGFFIKGMKSYILPRLGVTFHLENKRMTEVLGIQPRDHEESINDMAYSLIEFGIAKKAKKYKQAGKYAETPVVESTTETETAEPNKEETPKEEEKLSEDTTERTEKDEKEVKEEEA